MLEVTAGEAVNNRSSGAGGGQLGRLLATGVAVLDGTAGETVNNRSSGAGVGQLGRLLEKGVAVLDGDSWGGC